MAAKIATPPSRAVSFRCQRVSRGTATRPVAMAIRRTSGVSSRENPKPPASTRKKKPRDREDMVD